MMFAAAMTAATALVTATLVTAAALMAAARGSAMHVTGMGHADMGVSAVIAWSAMADITVKARSAVAAVAMKAAAAPLPAMPAGRSAPSKAPAVGISAPVEAGTVPTARVPAEVASAERELYVLQRRGHAHGVHAENQSTTGGRLCARQGGSGQNRSRSCDTQKQSAHNQVLAV